jgi:hypothetical protein
VLLTSQTASFWYWRRWECVKSGWLHPALMLRYFKWKPTLPVAPQLRMWNAPSQLLHLLLNAQCDGWQGVKSVTALSHDMLWRVVTEQQLALWREGSDLSERMRR